MLGHRSVYLSFARSAHAHFAVDARSRGDSPCGTVYRPTLELDLRPSEFDLYLPKRKPTPFVRAHDVCLCHRHRRLNFLPLLWREPLALPLSFCFLAAFFSPRVSERVRASTIFTLRLDLPPEAMNLRPTTSFFFSRFYTSFLA